MYFKVHLLLGVYVRIYPYKGNKEQHFGIVARTKDNEDVILNLLRLLFEELCKTDVLVC
jgi:hypothetical protein